MALQKSIYATPTSARNTVALVDIDKTLIIADERKDVLNDVLIEAMQLMGIQDIYLFTHYDAGSVIQDIERKSQDSNYIIRPEVIKALQDKGFRVHGVITNSDPAYAKGLGGAYRELYQPLFDTFNQKKNIEDPEWVALCNTTKANQSVLNIFKALLKTLCTQPVNENLLNYLIEIFTTFDKQIETYPNFKADELKENVKSLYNVIVNLKRMISFLAQHEQSCYAHLSREQQEGVKSYQQEHVGASFKDAILYVLARTFIGQVHNLNDCFDHFIYTKHYKKDDFSKKGEMYAYARMHLPPTVETIYFFDDNQEFLDTVTKVHNNLAPSSSTTTSSASAAVSAPQLITINSVQKDNENKVISDGKNYLAERYIAYLSEDQKANILSVKNQNYLVDYFARNINVVTALRDYISDNYYNRYFPKALKKFYKDTLSLADNNLDTGKKLAEIFPQLITEMQTKKGDNYLAQLALTPKQQQDLQFYLKAAQKNCITEITNSNLLEINAWKKQSTHYMLRDFNFFRNHWRSSHTQAIDTAVAAYSTDASTSKQINTLGNIINACKDWLTAREYESPRRKVQVEQLLWAAHQQQLLLRHNIVYSPAAQPARPSCSIGSSSPC